jgi:hypothetical protein
MLGSRDFSVGRSSTRWAIVDAEPRNTTRTGPHRFSDTKRESRNPRRAAVTGPHHPLPAPRLASSPTAGEQRWSGSKSPCARGRSLRRTRGAALGGSPATPSRSPRSPPPASNSVSQISALPARGPARFRFTRFVC